MVQVHFIKISDGSSSLSSALGDVKKGVDGIKGGTKQLKDGADTMYSEIQKFMAKLNIPETDPKSMQNQLKTLISGTENAIKELNKANTDLQGKLDNMDKQIKELETKLESLDETSSEYSAIFAMLESAKAREKGNNPSN